MTTRPHLRTTSRQVVGLLSLALFVVLSAVFLTADFGTPEGLSGVKSITAAIGYALFNLEAEAVPPGTEGFLVAFEIIDVVLVAALTAAVMLARRQEGGRIVTALADGGRRGFDRGDREPDTGDANEPPVSDAGNDRDTDMNGAGIDRDTDSTSATVGAADGGADGGGGGE